MDALIKQYQEEDKTLLYGFHRQEDGTFRKDIRFPRLSFPEKCYISFVYIQRAKKMDEASSGQEERKKRKRGKQSAYSVTDFVNRYDGLGINLRSFKDWVSKVKWMMGHLHHPFLPRSDFTTIMICSKDDGLYLDKYGKYTRTHIL